MKPISQTFLVGVDIGGTKTAVGLVDSSGHLHFQKQAPTCQDGPQYGFAQIMRLIEEVLSETRIGIDQVQGIGIGIPAVLEPETDFVIWGPNLAGWRNVDLRGALIDHFKIPVCIEYDGHTAVLGEWWIGAGKAYQSMVSIIIGTGLGGGMVLDGKLYRGMNRLAGAAGWFGLTLNAGMQSQRESSIGFWEARIAGPAISTRAQQFAAENPSSMMASVSPPDRLTARQVFEIAENGDPAAQQFCDQIADEIGIGIANVVSLVDPQVVILGGGVGSNCGVLLPRIREVVQSWAQPIAGKSVQLVLSTLGAKAGLVGAAYSVLLRNGAERS